MMRAFSFKQFSMEHKAFQALSYKANGDGDRVRTGIAAVFGNVDSGRDITHAGAFTKTLSEGRARFKHLWNHDTSNPPIAKILEIKEVGRGELPAEILNYAPEATGGLWVKREYNKSAQADWVMSCIDDGTVSEMSFGYNALQSDFTEADGKTIRNLREVSLMDTSDVNYGMNPATLAAGAKSLFNQMPLGWIVQQMEMHLTDYKAGRRNSGSDQILINALHDISMSLGCNSCSTQQEEGTPKSSEAEAAVKSTSLNAQWLELQALELEFLSLI